MTKEHKYIAGIGALIIILGLLLMLAEPKQSGSADQNSNMGESVLVAENSGHDFGNISMKNGRISHTYTVTNTGSESVELTKVYTSCMCTEATLITGDTRKGPFGMPGHGRLPAPNTTIAAGQEFRVEVFYDPNAHGPAGIGPTERTVRIEAANSAPLQLTLKANVTP